MQPFRSRNLLAALATLIALVVPACGTDNGEADTAGSGDLDAFCAEARRLKEEGTQVAGDDARRMMAERFTAMEKVAPGEVKADVKVLAAMWVDADENDVTPSMSGTDAAESMRPYSELRARHPKVPEAGKRFSAYVGDECGFFF